MTEAQTYIPPKLNEIIEVFQEAQGREKLELLLQYSEQMPPLPDWLQKRRNLMDQVDECMTPVFVHSETKDGKMYFYFDVPPQSPTIRGYAALLSEGLSGSTPEEIVRVPADFYQLMGLNQVLTNQRLNGMGAILAHMKALALKDIEGVDAPAIDY